MADISVTASAVTGTAADTGTAAATLAAGVVVFKDATNSNKLTASDCNDTTKASFYGITLNGGDAGQPLIVHKSGDLTMNAALTAGTFYYLSATAGKICPIADLTTGCRVIQIGYAKSTTVLAVNPIDTGIVLP